MKTTVFASFRRTALIAAGIAAGFTATLTPSLKADILELTNGDHYRGKVVSMTETNIEFISEVQGRVKLPRAKVAQITLKEVVRSVAPAAATNAVAPLILSGSPVVGSPANATAPDTTSGVVQQMQHQGLDPKLVAQVQEQIFGKASPEASKKFEDMMGGLMNGSISVHDVQTMAQNSIKQIQEAKKDLGGDAEEMLDGYLDILQKFVNEAAAESAAPATITNAPRANFSATAKAK